MPLAAFTGPYTSVRPVTLAAAAYSAPLSLPMRVEQQQQSNWCWATVAAAVANYILNKEVWHQCAVATECYKQRQYDCCSNKGQCNDPLELAEVLWRVNVKCDALDDKVLSFEDITKLLDTGRPVCCLLTGRQGNHYVMIYGYDLANRDLYIQDPAYGRGFPIPYSSFVRDYERRSWTSTYVVKLH